MYEFDLVLSQCGVGQHETAICTLLIDYALEYNNNAGNMCKCAEPCPGYNCVTN